MELFIQWLNSIAGAVFSFLPDSPFAPYINSISEWGFLGYINWLIPVGTFIKIGSSWLLAVGVYYVYQIILRWVWAVE